MKLTEKWKKIMTAAAALALTLPLVGWAAEPAPPVNVATVNGKAMGIIKLSCGSRSTARPSAIKTSKSNWICSRNKS